MTYISEIRASIYGALNSVMPNKSFYYEAPVGTSFPYCVFSFLTTADDYDSASKLHDTIMQISVFSTTQGDLETKVQSIVLLLNNNENLISLSSHTPLRLEVKATRFSKSDEIYQADIDFLILISQ